MDAQKAASCKDDLSWRGPQGQKCGWVSWEKSPTEKRCDTADHKGVKAHVACALSCGTCKHSPLPFRDDSGSILSEAMSAADSTWPNPEDHPESAHDDEALVRALVMSHEKKFGTMNLLETAAAKKAAGKKVVKKIDKVLNKMAGKKKTHKGKGKKSLKGLTPVQKALQRAANAKVMAMSEQQKALRAAQKAKEAAAKARNAPLTPAGHAIVARARRTANSAALDVQTAQAAARALRNAKTAAAKAILDKAGGKYASKTGFANQGGYFGAALRTAFHNGQLSERLKHRNWEQSVVKKTKEKYMK